MQRLAYPAGCNPVVKIDVFVEHHRVVVPRLPRPEPDPTGSPNKGPNDDQQDPHQEAPAKHAYSKTALLERVVTVPERIGIYVWENHQPNHDDRRHDHAGNPWIEVNQHFLK